ncbi:hypothetical protein [Streptococcus sp. zg-JUN1979]
MLSKSLISLLSALIFISYGLMSQHVMFLILGLVFIVIALANFLTSKK